MRAISPIEPIKGMKEILEKRGIVLQVPLCDLKRPIGRTVRFVEMIDEKFYTYHLRPVEIKQEEEGQLR
jgi:hypothetical protein